MDEADAQRLLDTLASWGYVEERDGEVFPTRKWNARLQAAAERINLEVARTGAQPDGNPLMLATAKALMDAGHSLSPEAFDDAVRVLVLLELSLMTPEKRAKHGFGDLAF